MKVATSIALGLEASPKLAAKAVAVAMQKAGITTANSVLLFLTSEFAREPMPAIKAAAKTANCLQVMGCSATGIFTEEDWVLDTPAAAAMVCRDHLVFVPCLRPEQAVAGLAGAGPTGAAVAVAAVDVLGAGAGRC